MIKLNIDKVNPTNDWSEVFDYQEDINKLLTSLQPFQNIKNIILIGNGGSITSYDAYYGALPSVKRSFTLWTMEPDFVKAVKDNCPPEESIVVAVSKSGNTLGLIETLSAFLNYKVVAVTNPVEGTLCQIARKMNWTIIEHPAVGGRFSGATSSAFVPAILAGLDVKKIQGGISRGYLMKAEAYSLSKYLFDLEQKGCNEVYVPIYSNRLKNFQNLIVQLMHESVCKDNKGQTFYSSLGPESQHHTNQRFLGGKRNVIGIFMIVKEPENDLRIELPQDIQLIDYKGQKLSLIQNLPYQKALLAEYIGTKEDADRNKIPNVTVELEKITEQTVGMLVSFWHLVAFYSSILRQVDPFNQPAVEASKNITVEVIKNY